MTKGGFALRIVKVLTPQQLAQNRRTDNAVRDRPLAIWQSIGISGLSAFRPVGLRVYLSWRNHGDLSLTQGSRIFRSSEVDYYFEFEGGLGDILHACFERGEYCQLAKLTEQDSAEITLFSVNPCAHELFLWHPNKARFTVNVLPHWGPVQEHTERRRAHNLPPRARIDRLPKLPEQVEFFPSPDDAMALERIRGQNYVVIAASAGEVERIIPARLLHKIAAYLLERDFTIVRIGRNYADQRSSDRFEPDLPAHPRIIDLVDRLSVPGTALAVKDSLGAVCSHSAISLLAWHANKPQLLLYPDSVWKRCFVQKRDQYTIFGANRWSTRHGRFATADATLFSAFCSILTSASIPARATAQ